jgi:hypothetical protein
MRDTARSADIRDSDRVLGGCNFVRWVAQEVPSLRDLLQDFRTILEAGSAYDSYRVCSCSQLVERRQHVGVPHAMGQAAFEADVRAGNCSRVLVPEVIGHQRPVAGAMRGGGKRPARRGNNHHGRTAIH